MLGWMRYLGGRPCLTTLLAVTEITCGGFLTGGMRGGGDVVLSPSRDWTSLLSFLVLVSDFSFFLPFCSLDCLLAWRAVSSELDTWVLGDAKEFLKIFFVFVFDGVSWGCFTYISFKRTWVFSFLRIVWGMLLSHKLLVVFLGLWLLLLQLSYMCVLLFFKDNDRPLTDGSL